MMKNEISANYSLTLETRWFLWKYHKKRHCIAATDQWSQRFKTAKCERGIGSKMAAMQHWVRLERMLLSQNVLLCTHKCLKNSVSGKNILILYSVLESKSLSQICGVTLPLWNAYEITKLETLERQNIAPNTDRRLSRKTVCSEKNRPTIRLIFSKWVLF